MTLKSIFNVVCLYVFVDKISAVSLKKHLFTNENVDFLVDIGHVIIIPTDVKWIRLSHTEKWWHFAQYKINKFLINETVDVLNTNALHWGTSIPWSLSGR